MVLLFSPNRPAVSVWAVPWRRRATLPPEPRLPTLSCPVNAPSGNSSTGRFMAHDIVTGAEDLFLRG
jgi:hypothetical protein